MGATTHSTISVCFAGADTNHDVNLVAKTDMAQRTTTPTYKIPICGGGSPCLRSTRRLLVHTVSIAQPYIFQCNFCDKSWDSSECLCNFSPVGQFPVEYSPEGYSPVGYSPVGYSLVGYSSVGYRPVGYCPVGYPPVGYLPVGYYLVGFSHMGYSEIDGAALDTYPPLNTKRKT